MWQLFNTFTQHFAPCAVTVAFSRMYMFTCHACAPYCVLGELSCNYSHWEINLPTHCWILVWHSRHSRASAFGLLPHWEDWVCITWRICSQDEPEQPELLTNCVLMQGETVNVVTWWQTKRQSYKSVFCNTCSISLAVCFPALLTLMGHSMLCISEEDKNEKGATADSVQQRRQYRRQNRQSSSG